MPGLRIVILVAATTSLAVSLAAVLLLDRGEDAERIATPLPVREQAPIRKAADNPGLAALRDALEQERNARLDLARQIDELREELAQSRTQPSELARDRVSRPARVEPTEKTDPESEFAELWFSEQALRDMGLRTSEIRRLRQGFDEVELEKLEARDRAMREGWSTSSRHSRELREIRERFQEEVGDEEFDKVLYASGRKNRVRVSDLLRGSAAADSGVEIGDVIISYGGRRVFDPSSLYIWTTQGDFGENVTLEIRRGAEVVVLAVPRGPLGGKMVHYVDLPGT